MTLSRFQTFSLAVAGITATAIGTAIVAAPQAFLASYGIALGPDPSLLSELRAPGAGLAAFGVLMLAGIIRSALSQMSIIVATIVFVAFPTGRLVGLLVDGLPSGGILAALIFELAVAGLCLTAFRHHLGPIRSGDDGKLSAAINSRSRF